MKRIVKALIFDRKGRVLLARRSPLDVWDAGLWSLPGGEVQPGEQLREAVQREVAEEVGLKVEVPAEPQGVYHYPDNQAERATAVVFLFATDKWEGKVSLNVEHTAAKWFTGQQRRRLELAPSAKWALNDCISSLRL